MLNPTLKTLAAVLLVSLFSAAYVTQANTQVGESVAFVSVNVVAMDFVRVAADQTVIVRDGVIDEWPGSIPIETPDEAATEVEEEKKAGYDAIKVMAEIPPVAYERVLSAARKHQLPVLTPIRMRTQLALHLWRRRSPPRASGFAQRLSCWRTRIKPRGIRCAALRLHHGVRHVGQEARVDGIGLRILV